MILYDVWKYYFGQIAGSGSFANGTVPELATAVLLILSCIGLLGRIV